MMKENLKNPWLLWSIALGLVAAAVRAWQQTTAFEGEYGLPIPGATASVMLVCILVMAGGVLTLLSARQRVVVPPRTQVRGRRWDMSFVATGDLVFLLLMLGAAVCALVAVPLLFGHGRALWKGYQDARAMGIWQGGDNGVLGMVTAVLVLLACLGLFQIGQECYASGRRGKGGFWAALPAFAGCGWLLDTYRTYAADPVLWDYVPLLLAVVAGMLMYTDWAGMSCAAARPRRTLWLAGATVICSWVALASQPAMGTALLLISQSVAALAVLWRLPANLEHPPRADWVMRLDVAESTHQEMENKEENSHE